MKNKTCAHCGANVYYPQYNTISAGKDDEIIICDSCYSVDTCHECGNQFEGEELRAPMGDINGMLCDGCHKELHPDTGYYEV